MRRSACRFQGGALVANYDAAVARAEQATEQYRRTIVVALREVSDALADLCFRAGVISYLEVLDAQRQLFSAQLDLNASEVNQRLAVVQLYRALGGGWNASS